MVAVADLQFSAVVVIDIVGVLRLDRDCCSCVYARRLNVLRIARRQKGHFTRTHVDLFFL